LEPLMTTLNNDGINLSITTPRHRIGAIGVSVANVQPLPRRKRGGCRRRLVIVVHLHHLLLAVIVVAIAPPS